MAPLLARRLDRALAILAGLSISETVSWGILYYGFAVFLQPMERDLHASRVEITGAFSAGLLVSAAAGVLVGRWIDRHGARGLMTLGSCVGVVALLAWARVTSLRGLFLVWGPMGLALAATLYEPAFAVIVGWFTHRRDRALLTLTLAGGLASTIFMPLEAWLVERQGWRPTLVILAAVLAVVTVPIHALVLRPPPARPRSPRAADARGDGQLSLSAALGTPMFWVLAIAFVLSSFTTVAVTVHLIPFLTAHGYSPAWAAATVGWVGAMQLPGRVFFTGLAGRLGPTSVTAATFFAQALALAQLALLPHLPSLIPVIVLLGAANGMATLARATTVADIFGSANYASISGAIAVGTTTARALAPIGASLLLGAFGDYPDVFWCLAVATLVGGLGVLAMARRVRSRPAA